MNNYQWRLSQAYTYAFHISIHIHITFITYHLYIPIACQSFPLHVLCLWHIPYLYFYCIPVFILCIFHIHSITYFFSCSITYYFIYFCTFIYFLYFSRVHLSCLIISHILFISSCILLLILVPVYYHRIAVLCFSYYVTYSLHFICIYLSFSFMFHV